MQLDLLTSDVLHLGRPHEGYATFKKFYDDLLSFHSQYDKADSRKTQAGILATYYAFRRAVLDGNEMSVQESASKSDPLPRYKFKVKPWERLRRDWDRLFDAIYPRLERCDSDTDANLSHHDEESDDDGTAAAAAAAAAGAAAKDARRKPAPPAFKLKRSMTMLPHPVSNSQLPLHLLPSV